MYDADMFHLDIEQVIQDMRSKRKVFVSEADLQLEMGWTIKQFLKDTDVRLEWTPAFDPQMHIDILVIVGNKRIPIELKYKTKGCEKTVNDEWYRLKNHSAKDVNCYLYLKDIQRIEYLRENDNRFLEGYTVFITNDLSYTKAPSRKGTVYEQFALTDGIMKKGVMDWAPKTSAGTKKGCETPIKLTSEYPIKWKEYSKIDETSTGTFMYLVNQIHR